MKRLLLVLLTLLFTSSVFAQQVTIPASPRAIALAIVNNTLTIAQSDLTDNTLFMDYNPVDTTRWARVDMYGMIRYAPLGSSEGVYTFSPYYDGYGVMSPAENKLFVTQADWSPNGTMLAFRTELNGTPDASNGVWFWQPARELSSDPSYQVMRHCPPSCIMTINPDNLQWRTTGFEWASDSYGLLLNLNILTESRNALAVRYAKRDQNNDQANTAPTPLRYDTGHWTLDAQNVVVSGTNPDGVVGFGVITPTGTPLSFTPVAGLGVAWVQDAVQTTDGKFYMFGSTLAKGQALQLMDETGHALTPVLGSGAPTLIDWNPERSAARVMVDGATYIVQIDGTVTDITGIVAAVSAVDWVTVLPATGTVLTTPEPLFKGGGLSVKIGDILKVERDTLIIYTDPIAGSTVVGTLAVGEELILISDPLQAGDTTWWKVQSINFTGWINSTDNLVFSPVSG